VARRPARRLRKVAPASLATLLLALLAGCGYASISIVAGTDSYDDGWLEIESPSLADYWETADSAVVLGGSAFVPLGSTCSGTIGTLAPGYRVSWSNTATGQAGMAQAWLDCAVPVEVRWRTEAIPLAAGNNPILVGALDAGGRSATDAITVYRYPR
jgi:hypothetical protein